MDTGGTVRFAAILLCAAAMLRGDELEWRRHLTEAARWQAAGELEQAAGEYASALRAARLRGSPGSATASVLEQMGGFYDDIGNFAQARACLGDAVQMWRGMLGPEHGTVIRTTNRLAAVYLETGELGKAERLRLGQWLDRLRGEPAPGGELVPLLQNLATLESLRGRFDTAGALFEEALGRIRESARSASPLYAATLNDYGVACLRARSFARAVDLLAAAWEMWARLRGPESGPAGVTEYNLGLALEGSGRYREAGERMGSAVRTAEKTAGPESLRTAAVLAGYARVLDKTQRKAEARQVSDRAARIVREKKAEAGIWYTVDLSELALRGR